MIHKCPKCEKYTLKDACPVCGSDAIDPRPARFSPDDKYVRYRLEWRMKNEGSND